MTNATRLSPGNGLFHPAILGISLTLLAEALRRHLHPAMLSWFSTGEATTLAGSGESGSSDGVGGRARLAPSGMWGDGENLYFTEYGYNTIRKLAIATRTVTTIAGVASQSGSDDGSGAAARFWGPWGVWGDGTNLFVTDTQNRTIGRS